MKRILPCLLLCLPSFAQDPTIAVIGLVHSHVWGHLGKMVSGKPAKLVGVAETIPELIAEAKKLGVPDTLFHSDYNRMLDQTKPQIVWAFVENNRHVEIVEACAPRGIHVIFEKPLAATHKEALAIKRLSEKHGIRVMTNYQMAWWASNYTAKQHTDAGDLGKVYRLRGIVGHGGPGGPTGRNKFFFLWLTDPVKNGAGALMDFGCYNALWSLWYLGRPQSVYATTQHLRPVEFPKVEDNSTMILNYKEAVGIFEGSWDLPRGFQELEVFGRGGSLLVQGNRVEYQKSKEGAKELPLVSLSADNSEPIAYMIRAIRENKPLEGLVALDINAGVVEIIDAAKQSIATGRAVRLR